jgi:hypothetical protein
LGVTDADDSRTHNKKQENGVNSENENQKRL